MNIFEFAKLKQSQKEEVIQTAAMFLESYIEGSTRVTVYYMPGFFIEVNTCLIEEKLIEIIPYKRGYKIAKEKDLVYLDFHNKFLLVA
jgi:hypothetical protein